MHYIMFSMGIFITFVSTATAETSPDPVALWCDQANLMTTISTNPLSYDQSKLTELTTNTEYLLATVCSQLSKAEQHILLFQRLAQSVGHLFNKPNDLFNLILSSYNLPSTTIHQCFIKLALVDAIMQAMTQYPQLATWDTDILDSITQQFHEHLMYIKETLQTPPEQKRVFKKRHLLIAFIFIGISVVGIYWYHQHKKALKKMEKLEEETQAHKEALNKQHEDSTQQREALDLLYKACKVQQKILKELFQEPKSPPKKQSASFLKTLAIPLTTLNIFKKGFFAYKTFTPPLKKAFQQAAA